MQQIFCVTSATASYFSMILYTDLLFFCQEKQTGYGLFFKKDAKLSSESVRSEEE